MRAVIFERTLRVVDEHPRPSLRPGWALIRVRLAGICRTDLEITKGYLGFRGVLGHEFVGVVEQCADAARVGRRVVGEINAACGTCDWCARGLGRHCPNRMTLGIAGLDGCMADYCTLPLANLLEVPAEISDERAVLVEPLSAACEILEQVPLKGNECVLVLGDGKLGILCAWVLATVAADVTLVGHHPEKLATSRWRELKTCIGASSVKPGADVVVEATGAPDGLAQAMALCRPRGTIVLKSTVAASVNLNLSPVVIHEMILLGSRCGRFRNGLAMMERFPDLPLERLITARYPIADALRAFEEAGTGKALKVLLEIQR